MHFDEFSKNYKEIINKNIKISGESLDYFSEYKIRVLDKFFSRNRLDKRIKLLDLGCGTGELERFIFSYFPKASVCGVDPSHDCIKEVKYKNKKGHFLVGDSSNIPFKSKYFNAVLLSCVFHHIPVDKREGTLKEIHRVLKKGGWLFIFEHNPFNPLTRKVVKSCVFDKDIDLITKKRCLIELKNQGFSIVEAKYIVFFTKTFKCFRRLESKLGKLFLGAQYFVAAKRK